MADGSPARVVKRRPKDRKAQIARASADAFSSLGYHAVGMEDIAAAVGISAAALYRHSSSKYELFRDAVMALGKQLVDCTAFADDAPDEADPAVLLDEIVAALVDTAIVNRTSGGLYRWEGRYLHGDDQAELMDQVKLVNRRLQKPLMRLRPSLTSRERWTLSAATLSVIGSIADHRAQLPVAEIRSVLSDLAAATLAAELPTGSPALPAEPPEPQIHADAGRYEALLRASMMLFNEHGYRETSMEDIAAEVGMPASGIYRYFAGKSDMLAAPFRRAADRVSGDLANVIAAEPDPDRAMMRLISSYVARSFDDPELAYLYYTERVNLPAGDQVILRRIQRSTVESWVRLLIALRPELTAGHARFAVHAGFAVVVDLGRLVQYDNSEESRACVRRMMEVTLLGRHSRPVSAPLVAVGATNRAEITADGVS
jgi:AcrR family transcriptional regulator